MVESLRAFCRWATQRGLLAGDPLTGIRRIDKTPEKVRRALTPDEIGRLLAAAPAHRQLLYEVASTSGLRAGELRALTVEDIDVERNGLRLRAEIT